jgi:hypothetical protein
MLLLVARPIAQDSPLPWQKAQSSLTPQRVRQSMGTIFLQIGTPAQPPNCVQNRPASQIVSGSWWRRLDL